jgi:hypothetical protein
MPNQPESSTLVIFGASGDLTRRKLVPALFNLHRKGRLPTDKRVVGFARRPYSSEEFRVRMREGVQEFSGGSFEGSAWESFAPMLSYFQGNLDESEDYKRLQTYLVELEGGPANRFYYLATSPTFYAPAVAHLERKRPKISSSSVLPIPSLSRSGTAVTWTTSRLRLPRAWMLAIELAIMTPLGCCGICFKITCCSSLRWWRRNRRLRSRPTPCVARRSRC